MRVITAEDIDFNILGDHLVFENMCKDLIREMGFYNVDWRDGSFDRGRDIEAELVVDYKLVGEKNEKWFFECKLYSGGVPVGEVVDKVGWATAQKADKLVILTSSHLSTNTKDYLKEVQNVVPTKLYYIEGEGLKEIIIKYDSIVEKYFLNQNQKLAKSALQDYFMRTEKASMTKLIDLCNDLEKSRYLNYENIHILCSYLSLPEGEGGLGFPVSNLSILIEDIICRNGSSKRLDTVIKDIEKLIEDKHKNNQELDHSIVGTDYILKLRSKFVPKDRDGAFSYFYIEKEDGSKGIEILVTPTDISDWSINVVDKRNTKKIYNNVKSKLCNENGIL
ncbi:restriction endonuclease [Bacillus toyonensis]|uniref:restriction endonuclease n=1 Tax=Bacillus toyonensis TaxID=155322 RepID=UPI000BF8E4C4|nr:restriction endonuclease [Bacillus toyonensis]PFY26218.1 hypothetical protein COL44_11035 [Bacillus toyonensis]